MSTNPDLDLFARVVDGQVTEYPVRRLHIQNRAQPISWYTPVEEMEKPVLPKFHYFTTVFTIEPNKVIVSYEVKEYTLAELLSNLRIQDGALISSAGRPTIDQVDPELAAWIMELISEYVTEKLSDFAATRNYGNKAKGIDPFISAATYLTSSKPKYRLEAQYLLDTRDQAWDNLEVYQLGILTGQTPMPISIDEIDALIPELVWPELPAETPVV